MSTEGQEAVTSQIQDLSGGPRLGYGLGRTLLFWFLLLPVTSLVVAGIIVSTISLRNTRQAAVDRLSAIAKLKQSEITAWVASRQGELALIVNTPDVRSRMLYVLSAQAQDPLVIASRNQLQDYVSVIASKGSSFEELFLVDASGQVLLSSDPSQIGTSHEHQTYFTHGKDAPYVHSSTALPDTILPGGTRGADDYSVHSAVPSIIVAQPVRDSMGRFWGVLTGRLSLDQMADVMSEAAGLGSTGETYLVNTSGLLLTSLRFEEELASGRELHIEGVERGLALGSSAPQEQAGWGVYANYRGRPVLGVYRWIPDLQMLLLAEQEVSETRIFARSILATSLAILLTMAGLAVVLALVVSSRITRPIAALTASANLITRGDLSHPVPHTGRRDEIGALAQAFDQMSRQLRGLITSLEEQVTHRTRLWQEANYKLQRRAIQLETVTLVGRAITSILNLDDLLLEVVNLIRARFDFYHAGIFLIDNSGEWAVLRQATGDAGQRLLLRKHQLKVGGQSIVGWVTANRQPRIALDVGEDAVHFKNPDLPHTRSEMALPLLVGDRLLGALDVQSIEESAFDEEDVTILGLMADQVAVAIDNALKFTHEAAILEATSPLYRAGRRIALATSLDEVLQSIVDYAAGSYVDCCAIYLYTSATEGSSWVEVAALWDRASVPPHPPGTRYPVHDTNLMGYLQQKSAKPLVVADMDVPDIDERIDASTQRLLSEDLQFRAALMMPLVAARRVTGLLVVASRHPHTWTEAEIHTFHSLSEQAAIAVENDRLLAQTQSRARRERFIRHITEQMWRAVDVQSILQATVTSLGQAMDVPRVYVRLDTEIERESHSNGSHQANSDDAQPSSNSNSSPGLGEVA